LVYLCMDLPLIVTPEEWHAARQELLIKEEELTRARRAGGPAAQDAADGRDQGLSVRRPWRSGQPFGRQEDWEDSPPGYPQTAPYQWWHRHDEYPD